MPEDSFAKLYADRLDEGYATAIVISHDCDLAADIEIEPRIELLLGKFVAKIDGTYAYGRNSRQIHLPVLHSDSSLTLEILARDKVQLEKKTISNLLPDKGRKLEPDELKALQNWLVDRYARASYSNSFNDVLTERVKERLPKIISPLGPLLDAIYFDVDDSEESHGDHEQKPFELTIYLRYSPAKAENGDKPIVEAARKIKELFRDEYFDKTKKLWSRIHLKECFAISNEAMTVTQHNQLRQWDTSYLSLRAKPQQPTPKS